MVMEAIWWETNTPRVKFPQHTPVILVPTLWELGLDIEDGILKLAELGALKGLGAKKSASMSSVGQRGQLIDLVSPSPYAS